MHTPTTALLCVLPLLSFASAFLFSLFTYFVVCLIEICWKIVMAIIGILDKIYIELWDGLLMLYVKF